MRKKVSLIKYSNCWEDTENILRTLEEEKQSLIRINEKYKNNDYYNWLITLKENLLIYICLYLK